MATLHKFLAVTAATFALTAGALGAAAPVQAVEPTPLQALQAAIAAPVAAFPDRAQVSFSQGNASYRIRFEGRLGQSAKRVHLAVSEVIGEQVISSTLAGYDGAREYELAGPSDLTPAERRALAAAGKPGPYLLLAAPGPWDPGMVDLLKGNAPITVAKEFVDDAVEDDVDRMSLPDGSTLYRVEVSPVVVDLQVDTAGRFVRMWAQTPDASIESRLVAWGGAVDLGYPTGHSAVSAADVTAAVAAYPRNIATAAVSAKAAGVAKKVNKWAKKRHRAVTKAVIKKRAAKAIPGYTVRTFGKGVKMTRAYAPAGSVSRCIVASKRVAVVKVC